MNHLSCAEARVLFGGAVSLVPLVFDQAHRVQSELSKRSKIPSGETGAGGEPVNDTYPPRRAVQSAKHQRSHTDSKFEGDTYILNVFWACRWGGGGFRVQKAPPPPFSYEPSGISFSKITFKH